jgi:hypothetical protein
MFYYKTRWKKPSQVCFPGSYSLVSYTLPSVQHTMTNFMTVPMSRHGLIFKGPGFFSLILIHIFLHFNSKMDLWKKMLFCNDVIRDRIFRQLPLREQIQWFKFTLWWKWMKSHPFQKAGFKRECLGTMLVWRGTVIRREKL